MAKSYGFTEDSAVRIANVVRQVEATPLIATSQGEVFDNLQDALEECGPFYPIARHLKGVDDNFWIGEGTRPAFRRSLPPAYVKLRDQTIYTDSLFAAPEEISVTDADIENELGGRLDEETTEWPYLLALIVDSSADTHEYAILTYYPDTDIGDYGGEKWLDRIYGTYDAGDKHLFPLGYAIITKRGTYYKIKDIQYPQSYFPSGGGGGSAPATVTPFEVSLGSITVGETEVPKLIVKKGNINLSPINTDWPFRYWDTDQFIQPSQYVYPETEATPFPATETGNIFLKVKWLPDYVDVDGHKVNAEVTLEVTADFSTFISSDFQTYAAYLGQWYTVDPGGPEETVIVDSFYNRDITEPWD